LFGGIYVVVETIFVQSCRTDAESGSYTPDVQRRLIGRMGLSDSQIVAKALL
jgi:hypothetical protein